jgi:hypothetical protein
MAIMICKSPCFMLVPSTVFFNENDCSDACITKLDYYHHLASKMGNEEYYENADKHSLKSSDSVRSSVIYPSMEKHSPSTQCNYV